MNRVRGFFALAALLGLVVAAPAFPLGGPWTVSGPAIYYSAGNVGSSAVLRRRGWTCWAGAGTS